MVVHMTFNHFRRSSTLLYPISGHMLMVDKSTSNRIVSIRVRLAILYKD